MSRLLREFVRSVIREGDDVLGTEFRRLRLDETDDFRNELENSYLNFHISIQDLGPEFTFTPRIPREPYRDINGDTIEDTRTKRTSWAPSIRKAIEALGGIFNGWIYATNDLPNEIDIQDEFEGCPAGPGEDNEYGPGFTWKPYEEYVEKLVGRDLGPADKAEELTHCVPDALDTQEKWATRPVKGKLVGLIKRGKVLPLPGPK